MEFRFLLGLVHADVISKTKNSLNLLHVTRNIWFTITTTTFAFLGVGPFLLFCFYSYHFTLNAEMQIKSFTSVMSSTFTDRVSLILSSYGWPIGWLSSVYSDMIAFNVKQQSKFFVINFFDFVFLYTWQNYFRERLNIFRKLESSVSTLEAY